MRRERALLLPRGRVPLTNKETIIPYATHMSAPCYICGTMPYRMRSIRVNGHVNNDYLDQYQCSL